MAANEDQRNFPVDHPFRVAFVTELYEPSVGGQQTRFRQLARGLVEKGVDVTVITTMHEPGLASEETLDGVRVIRGPYLPKYMKPLFHQTVRSPWGMVRFSMRSRRILKRESFDFIYFNQWPYLHVLSAPRRARSSSGIDWCEIRNEAFHYLPQKLLPRFVPLNLSVNAWTAEELSKRSASAIGYLPSGVTGKLYDSTHQARKGLLFLGRLVPNKNLKLLIDGFEVYRNHGGSESLMIAGSGPEYDKLTSDVGSRSETTQAHINILGEVSDETKVRLLAEAKLLVIPSLREGFPNVVVEAMASGVPTVTVSSQENGTAHVVEKYEIGTIGEASPESFAFAIGDALDNWETLHERCLQEVKGLDWSILVEQFYAESLRISRARIGN